MPATRVNAAVAQMTSKYRWDVFLSHNSQDKPQVRRLAERLRGKGCGFGWMNGRSSWEIRSLPG